MSSVKKSVELLFIAIWFIFFSYYFTWNRSADIHTWMFSLQYRTWNNFCSLVHQTPGTPLLSILICVYLKLYIHRYIYTYPHIYTYIFISTCIVSCCKLYLIYSWFSVRLNISIICRLALVDYENSSRWMDRCHSNIIWRPLVLWGSLSEWLPLDKVFCRCILLTGWPGTIVKSNRDKKK